MKRLHRLGDTWQPTRQPPRHSTVPRDDDRESLLHLIYDSDFSVSFEPLLCIIYTRCFLGKGDYPFPLGLWAKYGIAFFAVMAVVYLNSDRWLIRRAVGACIGLLELLQIRKRKVLI